VIDYEQWNQKNIDLNKVKASIVECAKAAGKSEDSLKHSDFDDWHNDYSKFVANAFYV